MEINFDCESLKYYSRLCSAAFTHEETTEIIVPDAMPDVSAVVDTDGIVSMRGKEAQSGKFIVSGAADMCVLYRPDEGEGLRKLTLRIPFDVPCDCPNLTSDGRLCASIRLCSADARLINSRKLLVRAEVCVNAAAYSREELKYIPATATSDAPENIEILARQCELTAVDDVAEKTFNLGETFSLPQSKPAVGQILKSHLMLSTDETEAVGSKLILKGSAYAAVMYSSADNGSLCNADFRLPFSVIMDIDGQGDGSDYENMVMLTGSDISLTDNGAVNVEVGAVAQVTVRKKRKITFAADAYSTAYQTNTVMQNYTMDSQVERESGGETLRISIPVDRQVKSIVDTACFISRPHEEAGVFKAAVNVRALCLDEDGKVFCAAAKSEAAFAPSENRKSRTGAPVISPGELYSAPSPEGVEIRMPYSYELTDTERMPVELLEGVSTDEEAPRSSGEMPSIIVFRARTGDSVWGLGKRYAVPASVIREANDMQADGEIEPGQLILISKQR